MGTVRWQWQCVIRDVFGFDPHIQMSWSDGGETVSSGPRQAF